MACMTSARKRLSAALLHNYEARPSLDPMFEKSDDSLSSLRWLANPNAMKQGSSQSAPATPNSQNPGMDYAEVTADPNAILDMTVTSHVVAGTDDGNVLRTMSISDLPQPRTVELGKLRSPFVKPPYSYSTLICMALKEANDNKLTLADIYSWIINNFDYYKTADLSWQNSIRHNLSLNKSFQKVPRRKDEPGKGGFWRVNPEYCDNLVNGIFKKRRPYGESVTILPQLAKRMKPDTHYVKLEPVGEDARAVLSLQSEELPSALTGDDFNWNTILTPEPENSPTASDNISIQVKQEKQESIMSEASASLSNISQPLSEDSNGETGFDDFFTSDLAPVDLSIQGHSIPVHDWWDEALNKDTPFPPDLSASSSFGKSIFPDQQKDTTHPWAEHRSEFDEAISNFDIDFHNLMDDEKLSSPRSIGLVC